MGIKDIICFWVLGEITHNEMCLNFEKILIEGKSTDSISKLIYEVSEDDEQAIIKTLKVISKENELPYPSFSDALLYLAKVYATKILNGEVLSSDGAKAIFNKVICRSDESLPSEVVVFEALSSEYDDFQDAQHLEFYGKEKCNKEIKRIELEIIESSKKLISLVL